MAVEVTYAATVTVQETLPNNVDSAADSSRRITHTNFNEAFNLNATTSAFPATQCAHFVFALTAGAGTIDLAALVGTNGKTVDGTGLRPQVIRIKNLGANDMTFNDGATNGYPIFGTTKSVTVPPGAHVQFFRNDAPPDIGTADKTIDVTGTGAQTAEVTIVMG